MSNATEITTKLWSMANKLRGTMDASEYKNYILPFMFYRSRQCLYRSFKLWLSL